MNSGTLVPINQVVDGDLLLDPATRELLEVQEHGPGAGLHDGWAWVFLRQHDGKACVRWFPGGFHVRRLMQARETAA